jgi:hypothetical protein
LRGPSKSSRPWPRRSGAQRRGPKDGHEISAEVLAYVDELKAATPDLTTPQCVGAIAILFGVRVHRRSLQRALARKKTTRFSLTAGTRGIVDAYERLRAAVLGTQLVPGAGLATLRRQGMVAWIKAARPTHDLPPVLPARLPPTAGGLAASELALILASLVVTLAAEPTPNLKVTADHLQRDAYPYVRQSTLRQVAENGESTQRQYALRDRAIAAGWPPERIHVHRLRPRRVGSQRHRPRWLPGTRQRSRTRQGGHRHGPRSLPTATLILDEDGVYDPASFNDRLLLGLKGTMSEAELHILRTRMRGCQLNKARRGVLEIGPPVGLIYRPRPRPRRRGARGASFGLRYF